jgi:hypothetical protein
LALRRWTIGSLDFSNNLKGQADGVGAMVCAGLHSR